MHDVATAATGYLDLGECMGGGFEEMDLEDMGSGLGGGNGGHETTGAAANDSDPGCEGVYALAGEEDHPSDKVGKDHGGSLEDGLWIGRIKESTFRGGGLNHEMYQSRMRGAHSSHVISLANRYVCLIQTRQPNKCFHHKNHALEWPRFSQPENFPLVWISSISSHPASIERAVASFF